MGAQQQPQILEIGSRTILRSCCHFGRPPGIVVQAHVTDQPYLENKMRGRPLMNGNLLPAPEARSILERLVGIRAKQESMSMLVASS